ncbi:hypothetical protein CVT25_003855, partial [Psilocybe cyanescens]
STQPKHVYLNSAKYLKIGSNLWVDRLFSSAAINATYSFHASPSAYSDYWNITYGTPDFNLGRAHIWQAFVQDSLCTIAEVTTQAYAVLGEQGIIRVADKHACKECTQEYKKSSDAIFNNPAAVVGVDENSAIPLLAEEMEDIENASSSISEDIGVDENSTIPLLAEEMEDIENVSSSISEDSSDKSDAMDIDKKYVKMVVLNGIVMGPMHCAIDHCANNLANSRGGSLCDHHLQEYGSRCLVRDCTNTRIGKTSACQRHQAVLYSAPQVPVGTG